MRLVQAQASGWHYVPAESCGDAAIAWSDYIETSGFLLMPKGQAKRHSKLQRHCTYLREYGIPLVKWDRWITKLYRHHELPTPYHWSSRTDGSICGLVFYLSASILCLFHKDKTRVHFPFSVYSPQTIIPYPSSVYYLETISTYSSSRE